MHATQMGEGMSQMGEGIKSMLEQNKKRIGLFNST